MQDDEKTIDLEVSEALKFPDVPDSLLANIKPVQPEEFDRLDDSDEPEHEEKNTKTPKKKKKSKASVAGNIIFYSVMVFIVVAAIAAAAADSGGEPRVVGGYSIFSVLTRSMQSEIPQGSLVLTYHCPSEELEVGDDITFFANKTTVVTHRIVEIIEDYLETGERAFVTQGVMNPEPDTFAPIPYVNVIGKVTFHNYALGVLFSFLKEYWLYILVGAVILFVFSLSLKALIKVIKTPVESENKDSKAG